MNKRTLLLGGAALALVGCAAPDVSEYAREKPALDIQRYFNGRVQAWGTFADRSGKVVKRFTVVLDCKWTGDDGVLEEDFTYSDGTKQRRVWNIRKTGESRFTGRADDVVGEAQGHASGNALRWNYTLALPVEGKVWNVQMDDWMYLMTDDILMNKTVMTKLGVKLGEVTLFFSKKQ